MQIEEMSKQKKKLHRLISARNRLYKIKESKKISLTQEFLNFVYILIVDSLLVNIICIAGYMSAEMAAILWAMLLFFSVSSCIVYQECWRCRKIDKRLEEILDEILTAKAQSNVGEENVDKLYEELKYFQEEDRLKELSPVLINFILYNKRKKMAKSLSYSEQIQLVKNGENLIKNENNIEYINNI